MVQLILAPGTGRARQRRAREVVVVSAWPDGVDPHIAPEVATSALLVIDTQVDFVDGGASPIAGTTRVLPAIRELLGAYRAARLPVVHVVRLYHGTDVDLVRRTLIEAGAQIAHPGSPGSQIVAELLPAGAPALDPELLLAGNLQKLADQEWAMWKPRWGAFHRTGLEEHLHELGVNTVLLAGCNYANCPRATIYGASERDYRILLASDAISGIRPEHLQEASGIGVIHAPASAIVSDLNRSRLINN